jgi:hypothetical protein
LRELFEPNLRLTDKGYTQIYESQQQIRKAQKEQREQKTRRAEQAA